MSQAAGRIDKFTRGGYDAGSPGIRKGVGLVYGNADKTVVPALAANLGAPVGVSTESGVLPDGTADPTIPDLVSAQKLGLVPALVPAVTTINRGEQAATDPNGMFVPRRPFSFSRFVWGLFATSRVTGPLPELCEMEQMPHYLEVVRAITANGGGTIGPNTRYLGAPGVFLSATPIPLYICRSTGETVRNLVCNLQVAPGGADTVVFNILRSRDRGASYQPFAPAVAGGPVPLSVTVPGVAQSGSDLARIAVLSAGDILAAQVVSTSALASDPTLSFDVT